MDTQIQSQSKKVTIKKVILLVIAGAIVIGVIVGGQYVYRVYQERKEAERQQMLYDELKKLSEKSVDLKLTETETQKLLNSVSGAAAEPTK